VIKYSKSIGVDVIITDHHAVPEFIPEEAVAIINPKRTDCPYPFKHLSGA
jgi:single-stranded-DNA-specific exonuclease